MKLITTAMPASPLAENRVLADSLRALHERRWPTHGALDEICDYSLWPAGKLLRPILVLQSCAAVGGDPESVLPAALAVEYLHAASLIHDDLVDGAELRRGRRSSPAKFGTEAALVAGDELVFQAFETCAECSNRGVAESRVLKALRVLARAGAEVCYGQYSERDLWGEVDVSLETYCRVAAKKAGSLLAASCRIGAILGGGDDHDVAALGGYAEELGVAFQMLDDLHPYAGWHTSADKDVLVDIVGRKMTLPLIVARIERGDLCRRVLDEAFAHGVPANDAYAMVSKLLADPAVVDAIGEIVDARIEHALQHLALLPASSAVSELATLALSFSSKSHLRRRNHKRSSAQTPHPA